MDFHLQENAPEYIHKYLGYRVLISLLKLSHAVD
jgi:hypothetical protein